MLKSFKRLVNPTAKTKRDEEALISSIKQHPLPQHIAIITDGNGRWARKRGLPRTAGHAAGMMRIREIIRSADEIGLPVLTFYSFSTENWKRPRKEVEYLMRLPIEFLKSDLKELIERNVKVQMLGDKQQTPQETYAALLEFEKQTAQNTGLILNFAINYGSRGEIIHAVQQMIQDAKNNQIDADMIDESLFSQYLLTKGLPDPDMVIRTSGEVRVSNFLLWQIAYSELWFTDALWPDFTSYMLFEAIQEFQSRTRRYGAVT
ncbi:undecaprenyl diphosphate synthase [Seinonella peptonophila]|uniref:Isoprenyl transferase n=1 Tax=Seinonella peptonophila TaxID=112248 RepID=A0A1M5ANX8_9BACL|nr:isoprenyl transferase [Seinonella peptonophila]SHF31963.1 undecaprenyl diphosphate synthase [Seinonella peptonophila]